MTDRGRLGLEAEDDLAALLGRLGVSATPHRLAVVAVVARSGRPVRAIEVLESLRSETSINRVTVYRILDLLVEKRVLERLSAGDRSFRYGLAPGVHRRPHAHFYCQTCGAMECLSLEAADLVGLPLTSRLGGVVNKVEIRLDGTCRECLSEE
ncbi:MAG: transcriptional repressor [Thermodesulfobacteriota bacterium]